MHDNTNQLKPQAPIAVGVDFSTANAIAVEQAASLAAFRGQPLILIHVGPTFGPGLGPIGTLQVARLRQEATAEAEVELDRLARRLGEIHPTVKIRTRRADGDPKQVLAEVALEVDADLLVVATHGRTGLRRFLMGSVAEITARNSEVDVLVARGEEVSPFRRVAVAHDFSPQAERAMSRAFELVAPDGAIRVLHAVQHVLPVPPEGSPTASAALHEDVREAAAQKGREALRGWRERFPETQFALLSGAPAGAIRQELDERSYDLLCVGSHGRSGIKRWLLGSVAETTVRHADVPVLIAKASS